MTNFNKNYTDTVDENATFTPGNNMEKFLAKMNGDDIDMPTPTNGMEYQLKRMAENPPSGGGGSDFLVTFTTQLESTPLADKTYSEILEAFEAGKFIRGIEVQVTPSGNYMTHLFFAGAGNDMVGFVTAAYIDADNGVSCTMISIDNTDVVTKTSYSYPD